MLRALSILALTWPIAATGDLVINEIDVDQIGADRTEFIEIHNTGQSPVDFAIDPHVLVLFNGGDATLPVIDGSYSAIQLLGTLEPGGFLVIGDPQTPNVDILLQGGNANLIQNGTDAVALYHGFASVWSIQSPPTMQSLVDAVVYDTDDDDDLPLQAALGVTSQFDEWNTQGSVGVVFSIARDPDGGLFRTGATPTPGQSNDAGPPVFAIADATLLFQDAIQPVNITLRGQGGIGALSFRVHTVPNFGTLFDEATPITGSGQTTLPHAVSIQLSYLPVAGYNGVDQFAFDAVDALGRNSALSSQELAVQAGGVVISEIMHSPGTFATPRDQRIYEYVEVFNDSSADIALSRLDGSVNTAVDTVDNMIKNGVPSILPAGAMRIIAPGGLTPTSDEEFACEWGLAEDDILRIPHAQWENMFIGTRILLFGSDGVLLDAVNLGPEDFWSFIPSASQSVKAGFIELFGLQFDAEGNDPIVVWPYAGLENLLGLRPSYSGISQGSPGFIPAGLNEEFTPLAECLPPPLGACCLPNGQCAATAQNECEARGGEYAGDQVLCGDVSPCAQPSLGACCTPPGDCWFTDADTCASASGEYDAEATTCTGAICPVELGVVINELDYTQSGIDTQEYIELYGAAGQLLFGFTLVFYNGASDQLSPYRTVPITGVIADDGFFVVGSASVPNIDQVSFTVEGIQNGVPDGVALLDPFGEVLHAIAYGGSFVAATGPAVGVLFEDIGVEDTTAGGEVALQRIPNGTGAWFVTTDGGLGPDGTPGSLNIVPLPAPHGACCLPTGFCLDTLEQPVCASAGGTYNGDASVCSEDCPILIGACCLPNGNCVGRTATDCEAAGGTPLGVGSDCAAAPPCDTPPIGACCLLGGACVAEDSYDCGILSGDFRGDGSTCVSEDCGLPLTLAINEVYRNDQSIDDLEFIELFGPGGMSLSGFAILLIEGDYSPAGQQGRIDKAWPLDVFTMPGDGFFVIGDANVSDVDFPVGNANQLENGTATILLVEGFDIGTFAIGFDIDGNDDGEIDAGVELGLIVDGIAFADSGVDADPPEVDRTYASVVVVGPDGTQAPAGVARRSDGLNSGSPTDFCQLSEAGDGSDGDAIPTPGANNICTTCQTPGDGNNDAIIDLLDFGHLQSCFTNQVGPIDPPAYSATCRCFDFDADGDIDQSDYASFQHHAGTGQ